MEQKEFEILIRQIRPRLHREAMRYLMDSDEAEDTTQEAVLKLWAMREQLNQYRSVEALAVVMVRKLAISHNRATMIPLSEWKESNVSDDDNPESLFIDHEEETKVIHLIATLPDAQQTVLRMKHIDGLETSEIAHITGSSEESVRQNLSRARRKIMDKFKEKEI